MRWSLFKKPPLLLPTLEEVSADLEPKDEPRDLFICKMLFNQVFLFILFINLWEIFIFKLEGQFIERIGLIKQSQLLIKIKKLFFFRLKNQLIIFHSSKIYSF